MAELERVKIIPLIKPLEDTTKKLPIRSLNLKLRLLARPNSFMKSRLHLRPLQQCVC